MYDKAMLENVTTNPANYGSHVVRSFFDSKSVQNVANRAGVGIVKSCKLDGAQSSLEKLNGVPNDVFVDDSLDNVVAPEVKAFKYAASVLNSSQQRILSHRKLVQLISTVYSNGRC